MEKQRTIKEIVEQLEFCKYEANEGHPLEMNVAFQRLKCIAELNYQPKYHLNEKVIYEGKPYYIRGMITASSSHPYPEVEYILSVDWQHESTSNKTDVSWVNEKVIMTVEAWDKSEIEKAKQLLISKGIISA